jgi:hypothetical protein
LSELEDTVEALGDSDPEKANLVGRHVALDMPAPVQWHSLTEEQKAVWKEQTFLIEQDDFFAPVRVINKNQRQVPTWSKMCICCSLQKKRQDAEETAICKACIEVTFQELEEEIFSGHDVYGSGQIRLRLMIKVHEHNRAYHMDENNLIEGTGY